MKKISAFLAFSFAFTLPSAMGAFSFGWGTVDKVQGGAYASGNTHSYVKNTEDMSTIAVIGAGYVGLVTGACFASKGHRVIVIECNQDRIEQLLKGSVPFFEPGLDELVTQGIENENLVFVNTIAEAMQEVPVAVFCCVGTPPREDGTVDMSYVWQASREIGQSLVGPTVVVTKSTVPVGTAAQVQRNISSGLSRRGSTVGFEVASNPEFLQEGSALRNFLHPERVVLGTSSGAATKVLRTLYAPFIEQDDQLMIMNTQSAELTKYAANAMLATRISFMNQLAELAEATGADIDEIARGIGSDGRIGKKFLKAGVGYGGSCFPKDVKALAAIGQAYGVDMSIARDVDVVNDYQRVRFVEKIRGYYDGNVKGKTFGVWGLSFKPDTDDIRSAPSIDIIDALLTAGAKVVAYDPIALEQVRSIFGDKVQFASTAEDVLKASDALVVLTEWKEFRTAAIAGYSAIRDRVIFDGRNCLDGDALAAAGIEYISVGRGTQDMFGQQAPVYLRDIEV